VSRYFYEFDCTESDGSFEIDGIPPGSYIIIVNDDGKLSSSEPFPTFYYPNVLEREKAEVITIRAGQVVEGIHILPPGMEETITAKGALLYSDGKPAVEEWVQFEPEMLRDNVDGKARGRTDANGRFSVRVLKGLKGNLFGELSTYSGKYENCPKVEELVKKSGGLATIRTQVVQISGDDDLTNIDLRLPFPACKKAKQE
jgi:hypothetical protein